MPLFGVTIGLRELRDRLARQLKCSADDAWSILWRKLRRDELVAYCEWAYSASEHGLVIFPARIPRETWVFARDVIWDADGFNTSGSEQSLIKYASAVYFRVSEIDFLEEQHDPLEVQTEVARSRSTGPQPLMHAAIKASILSAMRAGETLTNEKQDVITARFGGGASRSTTMKAYRAALSEFNADMNTDTTLTNTDAK